MAKRLLQLIGIILGFIIIGSVVTSLTFGTAELKKEMREEQALAEDQNRTLLSATEEGQGILSIYEDESTTEAKKAELRMEYQKVFAEVDKGTVLDNYVTSSDEIEGKDGIYINYNPLKVDREEMISFIEELEGSDIPIYLFYMPLEQQSGLLYTLAWEEYKEDGLKTPILFVVREGKLSGSAEELPNVKEFKEAEGIK